MLHDLMDSFHLSVLSMMTSSNGNIFRVTDPLYGEFTGHLPKKKPVTRSLMISLISASANGWLNNRGASDLRRHRAHYDVTVMRLSQDMVHHRQYWFYLPFGWYSKSIKKFPFSVISRTAKPAKEKYMWRKHQHTWWRHQMETFSVVLALCAGNSPDNSEFPSQRPVTWSFDFFLSSVPE